MNEPKTKIPPLESGLLTAMSALDNQVAREMQRTPSERDTHGVQKWEPYQKRIENVCSFLLNSLGSAEIQLDSLLILSQAMAKTLRLVIDDLGKEGLGEMRTQYSLTAAEQISKDCYQAIQGLREGHDLT